MELMARYEDNHFDLAIVDPPYGGNDAIGLKDNTSKGKQATKRTDYNVFENIHMSFNSLEGIKADHGNYNNFTNMVSVSNQYGFYATSLSDGNNVFNSNFSLVITSFLFSSAGSI